MVLFVVGAWWHDGNLGAGFQALVLDLHEQRDAGLGLDWYENYAQDTRYYTLGELDISSELGTHQDALRGLGEVV